jgi:hypothetical protein
MYDRPESLNPKAVERIGRRLRQLYADGVDDPFPKSLCRLIEELEHGPSFNEEGGSACQVRITHQGIAHCGWFR